MIYNSTKLLLWATAWVKIAAVGYSGNLEFLLKENISEITSES
jgi:hypothetical protein